MTRQATPPQYPATYGVDPAALIKEHLQSPAMQAFYYLRNVAAVGPARTMAELFYLERDRQTEVIGAGWDFSHTIEVPDCGTDDVVPASISFQLTTLTNPSVGDNSLHLRVTLKWRTSQGREHRSTAEYNIYESAAAVLADMQARPERHKLKRQIGFDLEAIDIAERTAEQVSEYGYAQLEQQEMFQPHWMQDHAKWHEVTEAAFWEADAYQQLVINTAKEREPQLLCMLSTANTGRVATHELSHLADWVRANHGNGLTV
jgi:hypothetical protein